MKTKNKLLWHIPREGFSGDFRINQLGIRHNMPPCIIDRPAGTNDFLFMVFLNPVQILLQTAVSVYPPLTLVIWNPTDGHYYGNPQAPWSHSWLHCEGSCIDVALRHANVPTSQAIPMDDPYLFDWYLQAIHSHLVSRVMPQEKILENFVVNLILEIGSKSGGTTHLRWIPEEYEDTRMFMQQNYGKAISIEQLAKRVHKSIPHFYRQFHLFFGVSPREFLITVRMQHAVYLLHDRNLRIKEIAELVGYGDAHYFSRLFKKRFGLTPQALREKNWSAK